MLRGKALNVTSGFSQEAFDMLTKAVKLDPKLVEAWVELGQCYWKKKDVEAAKNCFVGALNHVGIFVMLASSTYMTLYNVRV